MKAVDWREADPVLVRRLYDRAQGDWLRRLGWDASNTWREIEHARTTWGLPGLLAVDDAGGIRGWTYGLAESDVLNVGGLAADTPLATRTLVEGILETARTLGAQAVSCFMFEEAPGLTTELARAGFDSEPFLYMGRRISQGGDRTRVTVAAEWGPDDVAAAAELLRSAYGPEAGRCFAPHDTPAEWERYVRNLTQYTACGALNANASRLVRGAGGLVAMVLVTALSASTVHLAQVAVHPSRRGEGLSRALVADAMASAARQGYTETTLLVAQSNAIARRMYEAVGFETRERFVWARLHL